MSIMSSIGRHGAAIRKARHGAKSVRDFGSLPPEIRKDIGWAVEQDIRSRSSVRASSPSTDKALASGRVFQRNTYFETETHLDDIKLKQNRM